MLLIEVKRLIRINLKHILQLAILSGVSVYVVGTVFPVYMHQSKVSGIRQLLRHERSIVHALGFLDGYDGKEYDYTNSYEVK